MYEWYCRRADMRFGTGSWVTLPLVPVRHCPTFHWDHLWNVCTCLHVSKSICLVGIKTVMQCGCFRKKKMHCVLWPNGQTISDQTLFVSCWSVHTSAHDFALSGFINWPSNCENINKDVGPLPDRKASLFDLRNVNKQACSLLFHWTVSQKPSLPCRCRLV